MNLPCAMNWFQRGMISASNIRSNSSASDSLNFKMMAIVCVMAPPSTLGASSVQRLRQVWRERVFDLDPLPADRMVEGQLPRVKERPHEPQARGVLAGPPVGPVSQHGMPHSGKVHADLVRPARPRPRLDERGAGQSLPDLHLGGGLLPGGGPNQDPGSLPAERGVDDEAVVLHVPP